MINNSKTKHTLRKRNNVSSEISAIKEHLKKEDYEIALDLLDKFIENNKINPEAYYLRHFCHLNLDNHDDYIKDLQQACKLYQYENDTHMYQQCIKELEEWFK